MIARFLPALALIVVLLGGNSPPAHAVDAIKVTRASLTPSIGEAQWLLSADFYVPVSSRMKSVLELGVPISFLLELEIRRARWYWRDKTVSRRSRQYRLSYHPITRRYRLRYSGLSREFFALEQAIAAMSSVRGWPAAASEVLDNETQYTVRVRLRLDSERLPGPLQIDVLNNQDWNLKAPWKQFKVIPTKQPREQSATSSQ